MFQPQIRGQRGRGLAGTNAGKRLKRHLSWATWAPGCSLTCGGQQVLGAAGDPFLHVVQGDDVLGPRQQTKDVVAILLLGHLYLLPGGLPAQGMVAEEVVVHLAGGLPTHQQGLLRALEQLQALGGDHCVGSRNRMEKVRKEG